MSTAGKVLTGLILLLTLVWVFLVAGVAQLNREGTQAVKQLKADVAKLETQVAANENKIEEVQDEIGLQQDETTTQQTVLREKMADLERARSEMIKLQTQVKNQLEMLQAAVKTSESARELRNKEKQEVIAATEKLEQEVKQLKDNNTDLMGRLAQLRDEFKNMLAENRRLMSQPAPSPSARSRSASPASATN